MEFTKKMTHIFGLGIEIKYCPILQTSASSCYCRSVGAIERSRLAYADLLNAGNTVNTSTTQILV